MQSQRLFKVILLILMLLVFVQVNALQVVDGPLIGDIAGDSATVAWWTDEPCHGSVDYTPINSNKMTVVAETIARATTVHHIVVTKLQKNTTYKYRIMNQISDQVIQSEWIAFKSAISPNTPFRFASMADSRGIINGVNEKVFSKIVNQVVAAKPALVIFQGDLISGSQKPSVVSTQFNQWKKLAHPLLRSTPIYMGVGGHEMEVKPESGTDGDKIFQSEFILNPNNGPENLKELAYSFDFGNSHFVMLDSYPKGDWYDIDTAQMAWLEQDLKSSKQRHKFVGVHDVPYPNHAHLKASLNIHPEMRDKFIALCDQYGVEMIFCGHEHNYERRLIDSTLNPMVKGKLYQIKNGTCGAPIYKGNTDTRNQLSYHETYHYVIVDVDGPKVSLRTYDMDGNQIDALSYRK